jgi:hypothetical protein
MRPLFECNRLLVAASRRRPGKPCLGRHRDDKTFGVGATCPFKLRLDSPIRSCDTVQKGSHLEPLRHSPPADLSVIWNHPAHRGLLVLGYLFLLPRSERARPLSERGPNVKNNKTASTAPETPTNIRMAIGPQRPTLPGQQALFAPKSWTNYLRQQSAWSCGQTLPKAAPSRIAGLTLRSAILASCM